MLSGPETEVRVVPASHMTTIDIERCAFSPRRSERLSRSSNEVVAHYKVSVSFWIGSSARRAFGECLGSKRR